MSDQQRAKYERAARHGWYTYEIQGVNIVMRYGLDSKAYLIVIGFFGTVRNGY